MKTDNSKELKNQLLVTIIDKGVLGIILILLGFFVNKQLEKFKTEQQYILEIYKSDLSKSNEINKSALDKQLIEYERISNLLIQNYKEDREDKRLEIKNLLDIQLESIKNKENFRFELSKIKANKIGEVWEKLYLYESLQDVIVKEDWKYIYNGLEKDDEFKKRISELYSQYNTATEDFIHTLSKNRFWIGEKQYELIISYNNVLSSFMDAYMEKNSEKLKEFENRRNLLRKDILQVRDELLGE